MFTGLLEGVAELPDALLVLVTFLLAFGESAFLLDLLVPGEVGLVLVSAALAERDVPLALGVVVASTGAVLGDLVGYAIGRRWGLAVVRAWEPVRKRLEPPAEKAQRYFERRGGVIVFVGRWIGALRAVVPLVAGTAQMPLARFLLWSVPAAVSWTTTVVVLGYTLGRPTAELLDRGGWIVSAVLLVLLAGWYVVHRRRQRAAASEEAVSR